jgi:L-rhamnose isomerase
MLHSKTIPRATRPAARFIPGRRSSILVPDEKDEIRPPDFKFWAHSAKNNYITMAANPAFFDFEQYFKHQ